MSVSKQDLIVLLAEAHSCTYEAMIKLNGNCSMSDIFMIIDAIETNMKQLRRLTVQHSKEVAKYTKTKAGVRLNGKIDRRYKASRKY